MTLGGPVEVFDRALLVQRRQRAFQVLTAGSEADFLLTRSDEELLDRLAVVNRTIGCIGVIGVHSSGLSEQLRAQRSGAMIVHLDRSLTALRRCSGWRVVCDEEALPLKPGGYDAILSSLVLQHVNDLPGVLHQIRYALKPDGLFLGSLIGGETLSELRQAFVQAEADMEGGVSPRISPFADARDLGTLLQRAGFSLPVVDSDRFTVAYKSPFDLLHDLRAMGATNVLIDRRRTPLRRGTLARAMQNYVERFSRADGKVLATFEIITATAWAPHESQQKPLRPGSAAARLADALGTRELPVDDKNGR